VRYRTIVADPPWPGDWTVGRVDGPDGYAFGSRSPLAYDTLPLAAIKALRVRDIAAVEAQLYLWTTASLLRDAYAVAEAWGFEPMYPLVWCKPSKGRGLGGKFANNIEFVLFCRDREGAVRITSALADVAAAAGVTRRDLDRYMGTTDMAGWWLSRLPHRARIPTWDQWQRIKTLLQIGDRFDEEIRTADEERQSDRRCLTRWFQWPRSVHSAKPEAFLDLVEQVSPGPYAELFARRDRLGWDTWGDESLGTAELPPAPEAKLKAVSGRTA
jgi:N6-adenosine-specific RNA methylase IME4